jgi:RNA polymerase sigma factor (sigma-70 family)
MVSRQSSVVSRQTIRGAERQSLVTGNLRLVTHIAKRYAGRGVDLDDLIQAGCVGLIHAADRFDVARGYRFSTFAVFWIRHEIVRAIENESHTIRLPAWIQHDKARRDECARYAVRSLDESLAEGDSATLKDVLADDDAPSPFEIAARNETQREVSAMLERLNPREIGIIIRRFGLGDDDAMNLPQIGCAIGLSKQRVQVIERGALHKLKSEAKWLSARTLTARELMLPR